MNRAEGDDRPMVARAYSRRRILYGAALGGTGLLGLSALGYLPGMGTGMGMGMGMAHGEAHSSHGQPARERALRDAMRKLWEDHIVWTRGFIVSFLADLPDLEATTDRLLRNQADIGNSIKPFFGGAAGDRLSALLTDHILGAARLLAAARAGDAAELEQASGAWYANGDDIAAFLSGLDAREWPLSELQAMMREHLDLTLAEAVAQLQGDWAGSIAAYDRVHDAILPMADMLADGASHWGRH